MTTNAVCPFCGGNCDPDGWMTTDKRTGPACDDCGGSTDTMERWNNRNIDWNAAIEAAAKCVDQANRDGPYNAIVSAREIRKLKR